MWITLPPEEWRDCPAYPGLQASSHGRVRRLPWTSPMPRGGERTYELKPTFGTITTGKKGARHVYFGLRVAGLGNVKVHRAVCSAFHGPAPFASAVSLHRNENGLDNRPGNLKWGTQKENLNGKRFLEYCTQAKKVLVRKDSSSAPTTADIYIGLPQLLAELDRREHRQRASAA